MKATTLTRENIEVFVKRFYENIIADNEIGHLFTDILGKDINNQKWQAHIKLLTEFWSTMILKNNEYFGLPFPPHAQMPITKEALKRWLEILDTTLDELYDTKETKKIQNVGETICKYFIKKMELSTSNE